MESSRLISLVQRLERDLLRQLGSAPSKLRQGREWLLDFILAAEPPVGITRVLDSGPVRGLPKHVDDLTQYLQTESLLPESLCARYRYRQSKQRVLARYHVDDDDWRFVHRLARQAGTEMDVRVSRIGYDALEWHDELEREIVSVEVVLDPRALEDMLICALEAYLSPRKRKAYEVYGINLGMMRDVTEARKGSGTLITRYVSVMRAQPQLSAKGGTRHVQPSYSSLAALDQAAATLFPQYQLVGDFHSHVYDDLAQLELERGWEPSVGDASFCRRWTREIREFGHVPQVDMIVSITKCSYPVPRSHFGNQENTIQITLGDCRAIVGAHRVLPSGRYTRDNLRLTLPGMA